MLRQQEMLRARVGQALAIPKHHHLQADMQTFCTRFPSIRPCAQVYIASGSGQLSFGETFVLSSKSV